MSVNSWLVIHKVFVNFKLSLNWPIRHNFLFHLVNSFSQFKDTSILAYSSLNNLAIFTIEWAIRNLPQLWGLGNTSLISNALSPYLWPSPNKDTSTASEIPLIASHKVISWVLLCTNAVRLNAESVWKYICCWNSISWSASSTLLNGMNAFRPLTSWVKCEGKIWEMLWVCMIIIRLWFDLCLGQKLLDFISTYLIKWVFLHIHRLPWSARTFDFANYLLANWLGLYT